LLLRVDLRSVQAFWKQGKVEAVPGVIEVCVVNFHIALPLSPSNTEMTRHMARDVRTMPKGLIAPMPEEHRTRLLRLALIETSPEGDVITAPGRERLICDR
jgi:hypothetical protein